MGSIHLRATRLVQDRDYKDYMVFLHCSLFHLIFLSQISLYIASLETAIGNKQEKENTEKNICKYQHRVGKCTFPPTNLSSFHFCEVLYTRHLANHFT